MKIWVKKKNFNKAGLRIREKIYKFSDKVDFIIFSKIKI